MDLSSLLHGVGIVQAVLLSFYFFRNHARPGYTAQGLLLLSIAVGILVGYLYSTHAILDWPHLSRLGFAAMSVSGPLIFASTVSLLGSRIRPHIRVIPWAVPAAIVLYLLPFYLQPRAAKMQYLAEDLVQIHADCIVILYAALLNNYAWIFYSILLVRKKAEKFSGSSSIPLYYWVTNVVLFIPFVISLVDQTLLNSGLFSGIVSGAVLARSWQILYGAERGRLAGFISGPPIRYAKSSLSSSSLEDLYRRARQRIETDRAYLDSEFQLPDLAQILGTSQHSLSQAFAHAGTSFPAVMANLRLAEARRLLADPGYADHPILRIAFESGFNSKSSFNETFKKETGMTPSMWRDRRRREFSEKMESRIPGKDDRSRV